MTAEGNNKRIFYFIYFVGFLFSVHLALSAYINSTFMNVYAPERVVGILYTAGSLLAILGFVIIPELLSRFGNYRITLFLVGLNILFLLGLATFKTVWFLAPIFILKIAFIMFIYFNLDIFLESKSTDGETGSIRGKYMTAMNIAWVLSPMIAGFILTNGDYWKIYLTSASIMTVVFILILSGLKKFKDPKYERVPFFKTLRYVWRNKNIYNIFMSGLLLRFFYSWMVIYTPIYLHEHIGFAWDQIGIIFTIMLLPFVLFELPIGKLADEKFGEKELLVLGFVIMAISSGVLSFVNGGMLVWAAALFATRVGASIVEITSESYFFKQIDGDDANLLGFYRNTRPLAYVIAPVIASVFLSVFDYRYIFVALGAIMLIGAKYGLALKDTR